MPEEMRFVSRTGFGARSASYSVGNKDLPLGW